MIYNIFSIIFRLTWQSELLVKNVSSKDYGIYDCIAQNEMGLERYSIYLNVTSRPDPPSYLKILNVTYNSVNLTWTSGEKWPQFVNCSLVEFFELITCSWHQKNQTTNSPIHEFKLLQKNFFKAFRMKKQGLKCFLL